MFFIVAKPARSVRGRSHFKCQRRAAVRVRPGRGFRSFSEIHFPEDRTENNDNSEKYLVWGITGIALSLKVR
jgi:hypothetical protein